MRMYVHAVVIVFVGSCIDAYLGFLLSTTINYVSLEEQLHMSTITNG